LNTRTTAAAPLTKDIVKNHGKNNQAKRNIHADQSHNTARIEASSVEELDRLIWTAIVEGDPGSTN
jgi:hypothetical protein